MPQLLYFLHNSPVVIPLKMFCIINTIFRSLLWLSKNPRVKLEQFQRPKDVGGLALPNPWLYYYYIYARCMSSAIGIMENDEDPSTRLLIHTVRIERIENGLDGLAFSTSNKLYTTYALIQKSWNKVSYNKLWGSQGLALSGVIDTDQNWQS